MTILEYLKSARSIQPYDRTPAICNRDLDEMIHRAELEKERANGCSWCKEFGTIPLRGFTPHGCIQRTVEYCPMCGKHLDTK